MEGLDQDQMIVFPKMYIDNQELYTQIVDMIYMVKLPDEPDNISCVWNNGLRRLANMWGEDLVIVGKLLIVELRLPWSMVNTDWLCSQAELDLHGEDYKILDVFIWAKDKTYPNKPAKLMDHRTFESDRDRFEVVELKYMVRWKISYESERELLDIHPDHIHTFIAQ